MNDMNWDDLRVLVAFERHGTLEKAARATGLHLSTVSRRLRQLEEVLDTRLVEHVGGRLVLTPQGERACEAARAMQAHSDSLRREMSGQDARLDGVIRVGLLEVFLRYHGDLFSTFMDAHPGVRLEFLTHGARQHSLTQREVDVVMRVATNPAEALVGRAVTVLDYAVFAHPDLCDEDGKLDVASVPWVTWLDELGATMTAQWLARRVSPEQIRARVGSVCAMIDLAVLGSGACIIPIEYGAAAGLAQCSPPLEGFGTKLWVLTHHDLRTNARIRAFSAHALAYFADHREDD